MRRVRLQKVVVIHANHARELDGSSRRACRDLIEAGATVLNQSVLLAGINDHARTLARKHRPRPRLQDESAVRRNYMN
jgi:L-lysine 2,3-aminomutase